MTQAGCKVSARRLHGPKDQTMQDLVESYTGHGLAFSLPLLQPVRRCNRHGDLVQN